MNISPGTRMDPKLRELLVEKGWRRDVELYAVSTINHLFDEHWHQDKFDQLSIGKDVGRYIIEPGIWVPGATRFYIQVC